MYVWHITDWKCYILHSVIRLFETTQLWYKQITIYFPYNAVKNKTLIKLNDR